MDQLKKQLRAIVHPPHRLMLVGGFCLFVIFGGLFAFRVVRADDRILTNVSIAGIDVGGLTKDEAAEKLRTAIRGFNLVGLTFTSGDRTLAVKAEQASTIDDGEYVLIDYDISGMVDKAFAFGHNGGLTALMGANVKAMFTDVFFHADVKVDEYNLKRLLSSAFGDLEQPAVDAGVSVTRVAVTRTRVVDSASGPVSVAVPGFEFAVDVTPEMSGLAFDYDQAVASSKAAAATLSGLDYRFTLVNDSPEITVDKARGMRERVKEVLDRGALVLQYDDQKWEIEPEKLMRMVTLKAWPDGSVYVGLKDGDMMALLDEAAEKIESSARPTKLELGEDGRASVFEGGTVGKTVNRMATLSLAEERLNASETVPVPVVVDIYFAGEKSSPIAEELGIRELVGYGTSNFAGSPRNRRINIANGAKLLDGWIIPPGEEAGLIEMLKPFNGANGYLPELVIKANRTVPEYGGGLCQIGTTTFRAVMGAGLPITQRQNHSYRVVYYEPAGTDATLYDPAPDFRFVNDTQHHILLKTHIIGDILRFEFWGTRDGRIQERSDVKIWNITSPPPPKLIETSELPEGVKRCFESAHAGATTSFNYTITYPDGRIEEKVFRSVYRPWQAQCLIGKPDAERLTLNRDGSIAKLPPKEPEAVPVDAPAPTETEPATN